MFTNIKENFINLVTSRLFVLIIVFIGLAASLLHRVFDLQIVNGEVYQNDFKLKIRKERSIASTRGNIYDMNGNLLAGNELAYSVTIEDVYESGSGKNALLNDTIYRLIGYIEDNDDSIINDFNIVLDKDNNYQFSVEGKQLLRFLADVYGRRTTDELEYKESTATPDEVVEYLAGDKYEIGAYTYDADNKKHFVLGEGYTKEEVLKILTIRYAMSANSYQKFIPTVIATDVNERTVAVIMENSDILDGVSIAEDTIRKYVDSVYFSHIIGYTGKASQEEIDALNQEEALENPNAAETSSERYGLNDMVGKAGIEQVMERQLQGEKGAETINVDKMGRVIESTDRQEPIAGNDIYLTLDMNLQIAIYNILEQKIAGIVYSNIRNIKEYTAGENSSASNIKIPIYDVYFALIDNNVIDISHFEQKRARETETAVLETFQVQEEQIIRSLYEELTEKKTPYNALTPEYQAYESYVVLMLASNSRAVLLESLIDTSDPTYQAWHTEETISLSEYLEYAIARNWIDVTKLPLESQYSDSQEIYAKLVDYICAQLKNNTEFAKKIYKYLILDDKVTGRQICQILCEQNIIDIPEAEEMALRNGSVSAYDFMLARIKNLDITPAQLALDPCSGSCVVTDVKTGEVRALVTYPGYDNNRLANSIDSDYFHKLTEDKARPLWNYATQQLSAPGSTFKMVSATAGLSEGAVSIGDTITCHASGFDKLTNPPKCWINPSSHGSLNVTGAIQNSCNNYFYEVGYRLGIINGSYDSEAGLKQLAKYADLYGLSEPSGIELPESEPNISDTDAVRSAIGQGTNNYTTVGLARYVTTVANSGTCYKLSVLDKMTDSSGNLLEDFTPEVRNQVELPQTTWNAIHLGMRKVVEDKAYFTDMDVNVAGKTGTAQENRKRPNHALFVGYAPYEAPEISIATRVAFGYNSNYAAEISRDVFKYYYLPEEAEEILSGQAAELDATGAGGD